MKLLLQWWLLLCLIIFGVGVGIYYNMHNVIYDSDLTKLTIVIGVIFTISSFVVGLKVYLREIKETIVSFDKQWFLSETMVSLGMVGTVIGFIVMLVTVFSELEMANVESMKQSLVFMAEGMGTALWTTLIGLICSILLKAQLVLVEDEE